MQRPKTLWKSRSVEKPKNRLFHRAWKSRPVRGIPTFPQRRRRLDELQQPDISLATKSGHFNLLRTRLQSYGYKVKQDSYVVCGSFRAASRLMAEDRGWKLQQRVFCILADKL